MIFILLNKSTLEVHLSSVDLRQFIKRKRKNASEDATQKKENTKKCLSVQVSPHKLFNQLFDPEAL